MFLKSESGFTLIELLHTMLILGILTGLSFGAFQMYKENAEYAKATATLRNARLAAGVGNLDVPDGFSVGITYADIAGGPLAGDLAVILPGATNSPQIKFGALYNSCDGAGPLDVQQFIVSQPCRGQKYTRWTKFCGGTQLLEENIARDYVC